MSSSSASSGAPLPPGWTRHVSRQYKVEYWFHDGNQVSSWVHPSQMSAEQQRGVKRSRDAMEAAGADAAGGRGAGWLMDEDEMDSWLSKSEGMIKADKTAEKYAWGTPPAITTLPP